MTRQEILNQVIYPVLDELRESGTVGAHIKRSEDTSLFGKDAVLDSLALVTMVVGVEEKIMDTTGLALSLVTDKAMSRKSSPFRTIASLADYIQELISEV